MKNIKVADILSDKIRQAKYAGLDVEIIGLYWVHEAMREACKQCFDLASEEVAKRSIDKVYTEVDKQAILKLKDQIK